MEVGSRELEEGCRGEQLPCGPHYFPAVNFARTFSHPCAVDWREECFVVETKKKKEKVGGGEEDWGGGGWRPPYFNSAAVQTQPGNKVEEARKTRVDFLLLWRPSALLSE